MPTKNVKLKRLQVVPGKQVVVSEAIDTQVYTVREVNGMQVHLIYPSGGRISSGGWIDYSVCMEPTDVQLLAYADTLDNPAPRPSTAFAPAAPFDLELSNATMQQVGEFDEEMGWQVCAHDKRFGDALVVAEFRCDNAHEEGFYLRRAEEMAKTLVEQINKAK